MVQRFTFHLFQGAPMNLRTLTLICGLLGTTGALAAPSDTPDGANAKTDTNACIFFSSVYDWKTLDTSHLVIWAPNSRDAYLVTTSFPLTQLQFAERLGFVDGNNDGRLCGFGMDKIVVPDAAFTEQATIASMSRLDDAALAALSTQYHVKLRRGAGKKKAAGQAEKNAAE